MEPDVRAQPDHSHTDPNTDALRDDRACTRCATNLRGERVLYDGRTGLHIVACLHCGEREALEAYPFAPPIGAFVRPWAAVTWLFIILSLMTATMMIMGVSAVETTWSLMREVEVAATEAITEGIVAEGVAREAAMTDGEVRANWTERVGPSGVFARMGPWTSWFPWWSLIAFAPIGLLFFLAGVAWSILLWGQPVGRRLAVVGFMTIVTGAMFLPNLPSLGSHVAAYYYTASQSVRPIATWWTYPFITLLIGLCVALGVACGRTIARCYVRVLLPPPLRQTIATLWTHDGRPFPRPRTDGTRSSMESH